MNILKKYRSGLALSASIFLLFWQACEDPKSVSNSNTMVNNLKHDKEDIPAFPSNSQSRCNGFLQRIRKETPNQKTPFKPSKEIGKEILPLLGKWGISSYTIQESMFEASDFSDPKSKRKNHWLLEAYTEDSFTVTIFKEGTVAGPRIYLYYFKLPNSQRPGITFRTNLVVPDTVESGFLKRIMDSTIIAGTLCSERIVR